MVETLAPRAETAPFLEAAAALLGAKGFTTDHDTIAPWLTDWRQRFTGRALGMASPANTEEVAALVRLCATHGVPIVPQGGNSGMSGGATPDETGHAVVLSLRRMNAIRQVDTANRSATCEAGVILQVLHEAAEAEGLRFPLSLGGKGSATIGGLVSTNAGGTQVLRHGSMRALVLGLEAVMPDGSVFNQLVPLKKDNRGFDLKQLLIGSEGTLGIVTAATLKLEPAVAAREVLWAGTQSLSKARELLLLAERLAGQALEGFEVMPQHSLDAVRDYLPGARQPLAEDHPWHVLIEMVADADGAERLPELAQRVLEEAFEAGLIDDATMAANETQAEAFWNLRESIAPAERALGPAVQHDISVPVEKMPAFVEEAVPLLEAQWPGTRAIGFGHLGDGNIHFHVIAPQGADRAAWEAGDGKAISHQVHDMVTAWGGSISAEHGIGQLKRDELARLGDPVALAILRQVKQALDPQGLMNPGKLI
ncbi:MULTISPECIES: FAD-binding oxidoreductase [unclassified Novosphingobium]|uniref:FAD-binding oxidoreductase n=1 Tax=unclassified Novosphingobium TaxID=2644732 RepID=UPI00146C46E0|nr:MULTISPECIES: FAD-binding oxidoreductase [unclassified Novosphingobium]NMN03487.1 FAD/FMN-containing dehydrogenase [Novosphingobium sp. SG919]NMN86523.1 FAD/FMN-containing dehydrogenase [Novosphingobium sp. SG916]